MNLPSLHNDNDDDLLVVKATIFMDHKVIFSSN